MMTSFTRPGLCNHLSYVECMRDCISGPCMFLGLILLCATMYSLSVAHSAVCNTYELETLSNPETSICNSETSSLHWKSK